MPKSPNSKRFLVEENGGYGPRFCVKCKHSWLPRKIGGAKRCPRCQAPVIAPNSSNTCSTERATT